jgi:cobalt-zinc-cadmium efflux system membrane fusion protein
MFQQPLLGVWKAVYVELGQQVKRGQALANLLVPDLVDQQANLQIAQEIWI